MQLIGWLKLMEELRREDRSWMEQAACKGDPVETFFPASGGQYGKAKRRCEECEVRTECLEYALLVSAVDPVHGYWGGTTETERKVIMRQRDIQRTKKVVFRHGYKDGRGRDSLPKPEDLVVDTAIGGRYSSQ